MKLKRSLTCFMLALVMLAGLSTTVAGETESLEPITITFGTFQVPLLAESTDDFITPDGRYYDPRWEIVTEKFNVRFEYVPFEYSLMAEKARIMINGNDMPDAMLNALPAGEYRGYAEEGLIYLLPQGYEKDYPNIAEELDWIAQRDAYKMDEQYFVLPRVLEKTEPYIDYISTIYYRKDLAVEAGVEIRDYYTIEELYNMFEAVQAVCPDMKMYNHIWPDNVLQLGLVQAVPEIAKYGFPLDPETNQYYFAWAKPEMVDGIKWFKRFFDAGFIDKEFFTYPMYEANNQFYNNLLFCYFNGTGPYFFDSVCKGYQQANPGVDVSERIGYAYLLDNEGNMQAQVSGNSWSEYTFNPDINEAVLERFLMVYDWMIGEEGIMLCQYGREGIDYVMEGDGIVSLRAIDKETGVVTRFNKDPDVADNTSPFPMSLMEDTGLGYLNPSYSDYAKDSIKYYFNLRKNFNPLKVLDFDLNLALFEGEYYNKSALKPVEAIYKILYDETDDGVEDAWNRYLAEISAEVNNVLNELNAGR